MREKSCMHVKTSKAVFYCLTVLLLGVAPVLAGNGKQAVTDYAVAGNSYTMLGFTADGMVTDVFTFSEGGDFSVESIPDGSGTWLYLFGVVFANYEAETDNGTAAVKKIYGIESGQFLYAIDVGIQGPVPYIGTLEEGF
jgi:hypothetical protein